MLTIKRPLNTRLLPAAHFTGHFPREGGEMERNHKVSLRPRLEKITIKSGT